MKKILVFLFVFLPVLISAQENSVNDTGGGHEPLQTAGAESPNYDKTGMILSLSAFNYFSIGAGFNRGSWSRNGPHFFGSNYGVIIAYKTTGEMHIRLYGNMYGGASAVYMGLSGILCTNFEQITAGIAPEIGVGGPGISLFYRYNFYLNHNFNSHEIVLLIYPLFKMNRKTGT